MKDTQVTIHDVAKHCNLSIATVSRVISGAEYPVSETARAKVMAAVEELGYMPNFLGRYLKNNETNEVGVIVPNITDYFYPPLFAGMNTSLMRSGYNVSLCVSYRNPEYEKKLIMTMLQKRVKGIVLSSISNDTTWMNRDLMGSTRIISIEQPLPVENGRVNFRYFEGGYMAARHLAELGHKRVAFVTEPLTTTSLKERYDGFMAGLRDYGISVPMEYQRITDFRRSADNHPYFRIGRHLGSLLMQLDEPPTAIFALNDQIALGVMQSIAYSGKRVPEDVSVMGFGNVELSEMVTPTLSTIQQDTRAMGLRAIELLLKGFDNPEQPYEHVYVEPRLIARHSTSVPHT